MSFKSISREDWIAKITKDLKGKTDFSTLNNKEVHGILMSPFAHQADLDDRPIVRSPGTWKTGLMIDDHTSNEAIMHALGLGTDYLQVRSKSIADQLTGIRLDYLASNFSSVSHAELKQYASSQNYEIDSSTKGNDNSIVLHSENPDPINGMTELMSSYLDCVSQDVILSLSTDHHFIFDIARNRALRILVANIDKAQATSRQVTIHKYYKYREDIPTDENLIHESCAVLSSVIGRSDVIYAQSPDQYSQEEVRRSINIQNVFRHESRLDLYDDLSAGSFYMEELTDKLVTKVWEQIK